MLRILTIIALVLGAGSTAAASTAEDAPPPTLADACGSRSDWTNELQAEAFWLYTYDRVRLYAIDTRSGARTVVLAHGWGDDLCETLVVAAKLVAGGYRVVAFDFRGSGRSQSPSKNWRSLGRDLAAAVAHARRTGAQRIFLMGSSMGGAAIVQNTASLRVDGRISLSGTWLWPAVGINDPRGVRRIRAPFLYVGTRRDRRTPHKEALDVFRRVGAKDKRMAVYPGGEHGWQILQYSKYGPRSQALILGWLASHSSRP
jgi:alpha-beta hydrolase superfamily lysophospholipase